MSAAEQLVLSCDEYLAVERATGLRHQYIDGVAYAMAGAEPEHANVTANAIAALATLLRGGRCRAFSSDLKRRVPETGNAYYADAAVVSGKVARHVGDPIAVTNPALLVEVLSPSTETFDRGDKFADDQRLASLRHYLLVSTRTQRVEHYRRDDDGTWTYSAWGPGGSVELPDLGGALAVDGPYVAESEERPARAAPPAGAVVADFTRSPMRRGSLCSENDRAHADGRRLHIIQVRIMAPRPHEWPLIEAMRHDRSII